MEHTHHRRAYCTLNTYIHTHIYVYTYTHVYIGTLAHTEYVIECACKFVSIPWRRYGCTTTNCGSSQHSLWQQPWLWRQQQQQQRQQQIVPMARKVHKFHGNTRVSGVSHSCVVVITAFAVCLFVCALAYLPTFI